MFPTTLHKGGAVGHIDLGNLQVCHIFFLELIHFKEDFALDAALRGGTRNFWPVCGALARIEVNPLWVARNCFATRFATRFVSALRHRVRQRTRHLLGSLICLTFKRVVGGASANLRWMRRPGAGRDCRLSWEVGVQVDMRRSGITYRRQARSALQEAGNGAIAHAALQQKSVARATPESPGRMQYTGDGRERRWGGNERCRG